MALHLFSADTRFKRNMKRRGITVLNRKQWGSVHRDVYRWRLIHKPVMKKTADTLWQHITVTRDDGHTWGDFKADCREVERIGWERFGTGVSYNLLLDMQRRQVALGMPFHAKGSHTLNDKEVRGFSFNQNLVARAMAFIGVPGNTLNQAAVETAGHAIAAMIEEDILTVDPDYVPHRLVANKACPTDNVVDNMDAIWKFALANCKKRKGVKFTPRYKRN